MTKKKNLQKNKKNSKTKYPKTNHRTAVRTAHFVL